MLPLVIIGFIGLLIVSSVIKRAAKGVDGLTAGVNKLTAKLEAKAAAQKAERERS